MQAHHAMDGDALVQTQAKFCPIIRQFKELCQYSEWNRIGARRRTLDNHEKIGSHLLLRDTKFAVIFGASRRFQWRRHQNCRQIVALSRLNRDARQMGAKLELYDARGNNCVSLWNLT